MTLPYQIADELDVIVLTHGATSLVSPGTCVISGHDQVENWQDQQAPGQTGLITVRKPPPIVEFDVTITLAGDVIDDTQRDDFDRWEEMQRMIDATTAGPKPYAIGIYHPDLARQRITEVTKKSVGGMVHDGKGGATVKVRFRGFRPPKRQPAVKADGSGPAGGVNDPLAARKAERDALLAEAQGP